MEEENVLDDYAALRSGPATQELRAGVEMRKLKQQVNELRLKLRQHQQATALLERELEKTRDTISFRLGYLLLHGPKSWANMRRLPAELFALHQEAKRRRDARRAPTRATVGATSTPSRSVRRPDDFAEDAFRVFLAEGLTAASLFIERNAVDNRQRAGALIRVAKALRPTDAKQAALLAQRACDLEPLPYRVKWLAFTRFASGEIRAPAAILAGLPSTVGLKPNELARVAEIQGLARLQLALPVIPARAQARYQPEPQSSLYVTASALPYNLSGYTVRSHAVIRAIRDAGWNVTAALRPGYPADRNILLDASEHQHEDLTYHHLAGPNARTMTPQDYAECAAQALVAMAMRVRPRLMHAASNHVNALPALIAARRLGIPFVYEVRGMWELTAASRQPDWENSERFALERDLETLVAREADQVLTLTTGLAADLAARGVPREKIAIIPNCVDPSRFAPRDKDLNLHRDLGLGSDTFTIVYAGSLVAYEGLDDLLRAVSHLAAGGLDIALLLAGDGEFRASLEQLASELRIQTQVRFLGRLEPSDIPRLWSLAHAAAFPRKPFRVCQLVSPLKPLEPMTMGIPVVVSDVAALKEMVREGETGLVHRSDDPADLAARLRQLANNPQLRRSLGNAGRAAVLSERTWHVAGSRVVELYRGLTQREN